MKRWMILLVLLAAACAPRLTRSRSDFRGCRARAASDNTVSCGGKQVAVIECTDPHDRACTSLAVRYADGERVPLRRTYGTSLFDSPRENRADDENEGDVLSPEIAADASALWFRPENSPTWLIYHLDSGQTEEADAFTIHLLRNRNQDRLPLWLKAAAP
jgi:hypothetical protein